MYKSCIFTCILLVTCYVIKCFFSNLAEFGVGNSIPPSHALGEPDLEVAVEPAFWPRMVFRLGPATKQWKTRGLWRLKPGFLHKDEWIIYSMLQGFGTPQGKRSVKITGIFMKVATHLHINSLYILMLYDLYRYLQTCILQKQEVDINIFSWYPSDKSLIHINSISDFSNSWILGTLVVHTWFLPRICERCAGIRRDDLWVDLACSTEVLSRALRVLSHQLAIYVEFQKTRNSMGFYGIPWQLWQNVHSYLLNRSLSDFAIQGTDDFWEKT